MAIFKNKSTYLNFWHIIYKIGIRLLLAHGADMNIADSSGQTPLDQAVGNVTYQIANCNLKKIFEHAGLGFGMIAPN